MELQRHQKMVDARLRGTEREGMEKENFNHKYAEYIILHMTIMSRVYLSRRKYSEKVDETVFGGV